MKALSGLHDAGFRLEGRIPSIPLRAPARGSFKGSRFRVWGAPLRVSFKSLGLWVLGCFLRFCGAWGFRVPGFYKGSFKDSSKHSFEWFCYEGLGSRVPLGGFRVHDFGFRV